MVLHWRLLQPSSPRSHRTRSLPSLNQPPGFRTARSVSLQTRHLHCNLQIQVCTCPSSRPRQFLQVRYSCPSRPAPGASPVRFPRCNIRSVVRFHFRPCPCHLPRPLPPMAFWYHHLLYRCPRLLFLMGFLHHPHCSQCSSCRQCHRRPFLFPAAELLCCPRSKVGHRHSQHRRNHRCSLPHQHSRRLSFY